jgi:heparosan-N-sulfate-glucuronate 5-epimerase
MNTVETRSDHASFPSYLAAPAPTSPIARVRGRVKYLNRVASAYLRREPSQLTFWHEPPVLNENAFEEGSAEYYQCFFTKADYAAHVDAHGIPLLDYRGHIGRQYNPIAIAQWGLGNFNLWARSGDPGRRERAIRAADWLVSKLEPNDAGVLVWKHEFDWEYRDLLRAGWYSALAQGQGISLLVRVHRETGDDVYIDTAAAAFRSLALPVSAGGVSLPDGDDGTWLEETIVDPPTHILNGFLWALWGVRDLALATDAPEAWLLHDCCERTLLRHLESFDCGFWSLYEQSGTKLKMLASPFYHRLHISQLRITGRLLELPQIEQVADRWQAYADDPQCARRALVQKALFKVLYY